MVDYLKLLKRGLLILGVLALIFFITTIDFASLTQELAKLSWWIILLLIVITSFNILLKAYRWKILTKKVTGTDIPLSFSFASIIAGVAAGSFLPAKIELAKPALLKTTYQVPLTKSVSSLIIERILDMITLILVLTISLLFLPKQEVVSLQLIVGLLLSIILIIFLIVLYPSWFSRPLKKIILWLPLSDALKAKMISFLEQLLNSFAILQSKKTIGAFFVLSLTANLLEVLRFSLILIFLLPLFPHSAIFWQAGFAFGVSIIAGIISAIPGGVGITEISAAAVLTLIFPKASPDLLKSAVLLDRIISYYLLVLFGSLILILSDRLFKKKERPELSKTLETVNAKN